MKRFFPVLIFFLCGVLVLAATWFPPTKRRWHFDLAKFGKIPVLVGGRVKPLDTVARNSLLIIHGKQRLLLTTAGICRDAMAD